MYLIKTIDGVLVDCGNTRNQVLKALRNHQLIPYNGTIGKLPRTGKKLFMINPLPFLSYYIEAV